jgi:hypothetical protein
VLTGTCDSRSTSRARSGLLGVTRTLLVVLATKLELVINLKAAKALGLTIPPSVLGRADHLVE